MSKDDQTWTFSALYTTTKHYLSLGLQWFLWYLNAFILWTFNNVLCFNVLSKSMWSWRMNKWFLMICIRMYVLFLYRFGYGHLSYKLLNIFFQFNVFNFHLGFPVLALYFNHYFNFCVFLLQFLDFYPFLSSYFISPSTIGDFLVLIPP